MCGIGGVLSSTAFDSANVGAAMMNRLTHRGPDDYGVLQWRRGHAPHVSRLFDREYYANLTLVHRRLSILDLSTRGWQPMISPTRQKFLVYNGEIYNYLELKTELTSLGYHFSSQTDTEVLLRAYEAWGMRCLRRLEGMFAFALVDLSTDTLVLARDQFGIKPLYYHCDGDRLAFASEMGALLTAIDGQRRANLRAVYDYMRFGLVGHRPETFFEDVLELPAAHYVQVSLRTPGVAHPVRYWDVPRETIDISLADAVREVKERFLINVERHLRSDRRVGAAVSGGIDSSSIVMCMRHIGGTDLDLHGVTFIAGDERLSEERWVDMVGDSSRATVHKVRPNPHELVNDLPRLARSQGEPFVSTSIYAQYRVFEEASRRGLTVMLDGQGADELFAGYLPFVGYRVQSLVRSGEPFRALRLMNRATLLSGRWKTYWWAHLLWGFVPPGTQRMTRTLLDSRSAPRWLDLAWFRNHGVPVARPSEIQYAGGLGDVLRQAIAAVSLPALLRYEDRNSMAHSVESRVPFLTPSFVEFVSSLPEAYLVGDDATTKRVLRLAMKGLVPTTILQRRDKIGFQTPEAGWIRQISDWVDTELSAGRFRAFPGLDGNGMTRHWAAVKNTERLSPAIWRWISLAAWKDEFDVTF